MATRRSDVSQPVAPTNQGFRGRPEVIVELLFDSGVFHLAIRNIGERPAIAISVKFDKTILGMGGRKDISALPVFKRLEFLGPGREILVFIDQSDSYFARKQPRQISGRVSYSDSDKQKYEVTINHDLEIYRELPYLVRDKHCCSTDAKD